jgi:glutamyl-tRNA synthetase
MLERIITRLAPSPTGSQHLGYARTYLISWLWARQRTGQVKLRIEDIDSPRIKAGATDEALDDLRWLGLDWDREPMVQTQRLAIYETTLQQLQAQECVYPCICSRSDIASAASAPHAEGDEPPYPGTCAHRKVSEAATLTVPFAWRYRVTDSPSFVDGLRGPTVVDLRQQGGDFVVWKAAGSPAYQLAVVVDDAAQDITDVIRGDDLVSSTPRQLLLYRQLNLIPPRFAHVPLVVGPDGRRLAKRHGDTRLRSLRDQGVSAESVVGLLAWSCGWTDTIRPIAACDLLSRFELAAIPKHPFVLENQHLKAIGYSA